MAEEDVVDLTTNGNTDPVLLMNKDSQDSAAAGDPDTVTVLEDSATKTVDKTVGPATKTAVEKSTAKKSRGKKSGAKKSGPKKATKTQIAAVAQQAKFPRHSVEKALRVPRAIYQQNAGKPATVTEAAKFTTGGSPNGPFTVEVSSSKKYGFLRSEAGKLVLEDRARKAVAPQSETDRITALQEAVLSAPDLSAVYNHYRGENLPDAEFFRNALIDKFSIPADKVSEFLEVFYESVRAAELIDESGERPRLVDVGRDDRHKPTGGSAAVAKVSVAKGTTCFVMQPFSGPLGGYYESIFKPAIQQAGLEPVRADAEIFHTGKIMDQVWRGIREAKVLVAELTTKNPNVFYELGLAHALEKPVVLVSSNQDDVPFDLRHIRVILYDQTDPFWGEKLINKIADNIASAITNPDEAIFRADDAARSA
jgi:hypothetical protein